MQRIRAELPPATARQRLAVKTYLKMILILLVNQYASHAGTVENFNRQQRALERLRSLFAELEKNHDQAIPLNDAASLCQMSKSYFTSFFKKVTGQSFTAYLNHFRVERAPVPAGDHRSFDFGDLPDRLLLRSKLLRSGVSEVEKSLPSSPPMEPDAAERLCAEVRQARRIAYYGVGREGLMMKAL